MSKPLTIERNGPVARLTLHGVLDERALADACGALADDAEVRTVVVTGAAGEVDVAHDPFECVAALPMPVVAAVSGEVSGGTLALALAADIRIAGEGARFGVPEVAQGRLPAPGTIARLVRLVGPGDAARLVLTGDAIDAAEALRIGLVSEVALDAVTRADEIAQRIAERGPIAVRYAKEAVSRGLEMALEQALRFETDLTVILQATEDRAEGVRAFLDKQQPKFKGK